MNHDKVKPSKRLSAALLIVCALGGALWLWDSVVKDRVVPKRWAAVEGHRLYRSGQLSASLVQRTLARHGIKVIVALTADDPDSKDQQAEKNAAAALGIELLRFPLRGDGTGDVNQYIGAIAAVIQAERQGKPVLVHCAAGAQRTGGVVACFQLLVDRKPAAGVIRELRQHGWNPNRNPHLLPYLNENLAPIATALHDHGLLHDIPDPLPVLTAP